MAIQLINIRTRWLIISKVIQQPDERFILLTKYFIQFNVHESVILKRMRFKEPWTLVKPHKQWLFLALYNRRQLKQITNQQELNTTKTLREIATC